VLAGKGALRRAKQRRALAGSAPFRQAELAMGGSGGITILHEINTANALLAEVSTLLKTGTFYFALTYLPSLTGRIRTS
jgi:hypothetical protein